VSELAPIMTRVVAFVAESFCCSAIRFGMVIGVTQN
jgi:hypothetical protein